MSKKIIQSILLAIFFLLANSGLAQDYDLIVSTKGDSIACHIDSVTESAYRGNLPSNSVYIGIMSISYSRVFAGNPVGITIGIGLSYIDAPGLMIESTLLKGKNRHFFEPGIMGVYQSDLGGGVFIRAGYRYQGPKGFLFRAAPLLGYIDGGFMPLPAISIGYSF